MNKSVRHGLLSSPRAVLMAGAVCISALSGLFAITKASATPQRGLDDLTAVVNDTMGLLRSNIVDLQLDPTPGRSAMIAIPLAGENLTLDLVPSSVQSERYRVSIQIDDGSLVEIQPAPSRTMNGRVMERPGSRVAASLQEDGLYAWISIDQDVYWVEPVSAHVPGTPAGLHVVYNSADTTCEGTCGVTAMQHHVDHFRGMEQALPINSGVCKLAPLAADADYHYYQSLGSNVTSVQNSINAIINALNVQYGNEVGINFQLSELIIRTSSGANPYSTNNAEVLLEQFRSVWLSPPESSIPRALAHLFTGRNLSGSTIGVAWLGTVCHPPHGYNYGLSQRVSPFACHTDLVAHEVGHNWNAQHCNCPNHTMHPSLTCANQFHSSSINAIIAYRNAVSCLPNCTDPPANDDCQSTQVVLEGATPFDNIDATTDGPAEPSCAFGGDSQIQRDVWFGHVAQCTGELTISLCDSTFATKIAVYDFPCPTQSGTVLACDTISCPTNNRSQITIPVTAGQALRIRVGGLNGAQGQGILNIHCEPSAPQCPADINGDSLVDISDMMDVLSAWGACSGCAADINNDGVVDIADMMAVLSNWGDC